MDSTGQLASTEAAKAEGVPGDYQVLARTYRPKNFSDIIGQDDCVQILTHALQSHRVGHAFLFVGERGVGKTTLARLLARALNCTGVQSQRGSAGVDPCGTCSACVEIAQDRQLDILEMDAASHTGVDDVRAIIEGARYRPATLTYKVFIIDEVHMLSKSAFNALLKTLEEPPPHVKFIFATTELQKVPLTIRSRCQFFDLKRMSQGTLEAYFTTIALKEGVTITSEAIRLIARGADGSVRDGLSLLDHAFNYVTSEGLEKGIQESHIRQMFGLCDRGDMIQLFTQVMAGNQEMVLSSLDTHVALGQDPQKILQDLLEICYQITRYKCSSSYDLSLFAKDIQEALKDLSSRLSMEVLHRTWQVLVKGLEEVRMSNLPELACGMVLIRVMFIKDYGAVASQDPQVLSLQDKPKERSYEVLMDVNSSLSVRGQHEEEQKKEKLLEEKEQGDKEQSKGKNTGPLENFEQILDFLKQHKEMRLYSDLYAYGRFVSLEGETLTLSLQEFQGSSSLKRDLENTLKKHTGGRWVVALSTSGDGLPPKEEQDVLLETARHDYVKKNPLIQEILTTFPQSRLELVNRSK